MGYARFMAGEVFVFELENRPVLQWVFSCASLW